jgi:hypothetical protein
MKYSCPKCKFLWEGNLEDFSVVLQHEKTHNPKSKEKAEKLV